VVFDHCICNASPFASWSDYLPSSTTPFQLHFPSLSPPPVQFAGQQGQDAFSENKSSNVLQETLVYTSRSPIDQVIGVSDKTDQAMSGSEQIQLPFPEIDRVVVQYVK